MRYVILGAGAMGGSIGGRLFEHGRDVVLVARGDHQAAIATRGLELRDPDRSVTLLIPSVSSVADVGFEQGDVAVLATKTQQSEAILAELAVHAPSDIHVVCAQNGVENERLALRRFADTYSVVVQLPATHLVPGVVVAHSAPITGSLDIGRHPSGLDARAREVAAVFEASGFASVAREDVARWKYAKFLRNVGNAVDALFDHAEGAPEVERRARAEAVRVLGAAGIDYVDDELYEERFRRLITVQPIAGAPRDGGSSWQSLARRSGVIEADLLNGEAVLLGRLHGVPTPVNELLRRLAVADARAGAPPGSHAQDDFLAMLAER